MNKKLIIILIMLAIVLLISFFIISIKNDYDKECFEKYCSIRLFVDRNATDDEINNIRNKLENIGNIKSIKYISKEEALQQIKDRLGEKSLLEDRDSSIFPVSFELTLNITNKKDGKMIKEKVMKEVSEIEGIDKIKISEEPTLIEILQNKIYILMRKLN